MMSKIIMKCGMENWNLILNRLYSLTEKWWNVTGPGNGIKSFFFADSCSLDIDFEEVS